MRYASFASLLFLAACASTPETQFHILPNLVPTESALFEGESVALRALDLPLYARASQVAHLQGGSIALEDEHRWADEPQRATAISVPVSAESFEALTFAHSAALAALSDQIVAAIAAGS